MSSIYRKGRDGYFYYQTYVYNPETKKKNKKIFHSLNTKSLTEAKKKKHELDNKYLKEKNTRTFKSEILKVQQTKVILIFLLLFCFISYLIINKNEIKPNLNQEKNYNIIKDTITKNNRTNTDIISQKPFKEQMTDIKPVNSFEKKDSLILFKSENRSVENIEITLPTYEVRRVEKLPGAIRIVKLFVTIRKDVSSARQEFLCRYLKNQNSDFSNIIICLYSDDKIGKELADGLLTNLSSQKQQKSWLALYTFNKVEGEYFDGQPANFMIN